jgi:tetratricopeptide (TPR) repeat protein
VQNIAAAKQRIPEHRRRPFVLQHLGTMYLEQGLHQKALPYLEAAARKQPDNHNIHFALGKAQEATGQLKAAHASYTRAVNCRKTKYNLEFEEAQNALQRATENLASAPPRGSAGDSERQRRRYRILQRSAWFRFYHQQNPAAHFLSCLFCCGASKALPGRKSYIRIGNHAEGAASCPCGACKAERSDTKQT